MTRTHDRFDDSDDLDLSLAAILGYVLSAIGLTFGVWVFVVVYLTVLS